MAHIKAYQVKLAEIYEKYRTNTMVSSDYADMFILLKQNQMYVNSVTKLQELSYFAHTTNDKAWQEEISERMTRLTKDAEAIEA